MEESLGWLSAPRGLCSSVLRGPPRPALSCPILSVEGLAQGSALCCLFQAGLSLPGCVPVAVEGLAGGGVMALSPSAWFLLSPALSPFQIC